ncbi:MAG: prolipoprotein diacylglyceryl transferase [Alphaproteobacteria bacterium]|nr:prolipoprotein diacylglyceryl transferase [Alphaproteobacteria bacterium]
MLLSTLALAFPQVDPVALQLGPLVIRWYSLAYIAGILGGWWYCTKLTYRAEAVSGSPALSPKAVEDIVVWIILGVVLGGRLGYVLFYQPAYYFENPSQILHVWQGGMSFHGGFLGVLVATWLYVKKHRYTFFRAMDMFACVTPIGLFFGRVANFVNGELYGRVTDVPWAVVFPHGGMLPRHPSQLYEAVLEGLVTLAVLGYLAYRTKALARPRLISGAFLICYGLSRTLVEMVREPDEQLGFLFGGFLTMGMLLSIPMVLLGIWLIYVAKKAPALYELPAETAKPKAKKEAALP